MECDFSKMYSELSELLQDICKFLSADKLGNLSPKDQKLAQSLITRSKTQLQEISKIQPSLPPNEDYVIMNSQVIIKEDQEDIYSSVDDVRYSLKSDRSIIPDDADNPYKDLPAKDTSHGIKSGWISMRRRFLLSFEKMRRVYATIHNNWLLIYLTERDIKPLCTFNLQYFEAKESDGEKCNFELMSTKQNDNKVYYFIALTHKDMLQWTVQINKCHDMAIGKDMDIDTSDAYYEKEYFDSLKAVDNTNNDDDDSDGIYEQLTTIKKPTEIKPISGPIKTSGSVTSNTYPKPRPILRQNSKPTKGPVKVPPPVVKQKSISPTNSSGSLVSYHEIDIEVNNKSSSNSTKSVDDSFSDDSGDSTYETFASVKSTIVNKNSRDKSIRNKKTIAPPTVPTKKKTF